MSSAQGAGRDGRFSNEATGVRRVVGNHANKAEAASAVDQLSTSASFPWGINCVRREGDQLIGKNRWAGICASAALEMSLDPNDLRVIILGAGGAARAVALALVDNGAHVRLLTAALNPPAS